MEWFIKKGKDRKEKRSGRTGGEVEKREEGLKRKGTKREEGVYVGGGVEGGQEGAERKGRMSWKIEYTWGGGGEEGRRVYS
jgi:hypothetical protein